VPQQRVVVQELEDVHHHLDGDAGADRRALPWTGAQPQEPIHLEAALPVIDHMGINRQQGSHASGAKADLEQFDNPPASLFLGGVLTVCPKADQQVFRSQRVFQPLGMRRRLEGQAKLLPRRSRERGDLCGPVVMAPQDLRREVMLGEHALNPPMIDGIAIALPDNPRQLASGEEMGDGQTDDVLLNGPREEI
jgi:hypothetical protein